MILAALEGEVEEYVTRHREARDARGHAVVVRNGAARLRRLTLGFGTVTLRVPRVTDQRVLDTAASRTKTAAVMIHVVLLFFKSASQFPAMVPDTMARDNAQIGEGMGYGFHNRDPLLCETVMDFSTPATTRSCWRKVSSGNMGSDNTWEAAFSATGKLPTRKPSPS